MRTLTAAGIAVLTLAFAGPAQAATAARDGDTVTYRAAAGESNFVLADIMGERLVFGDAVLTMRAGRGCTRRQRQDSAAELYCPSAVSRVVMSVGDRDDLVALLFARSGPSVTVSGGAGRDAIVYFPGDRPVRISLDGVANDGPPGRSDDIEPDVEEALGTSVGGDVLVGSARANLLDPRGGSDTVDAAGGNDLVDTRDRTDCGDYRRCRPARKDLVTCGAGRDIADGDRLDDIAADCEVIVRNGTTSLTDGDDRFTGFRERLTVFGRAGNDRLTGNGRDTLVGGAGNDVLRAVYVHNRLRGGPGNDKVYGAFGRDRIAGGPGNDRLLASTGNDYVDGGAGRDRVRAGTGADLITVRDGTRDRVRCGAGNDRVVADAGDVVGRDCERRLRRLPGSR
jgi:Ca2+-binding RTX toxin-like protein